MDAVVRHLPEGLVNRIAAGEVIERPAAAVKELVENALDAGAARITIRLEGGGIDRIEIVDDGRGMGPEDLALAVLRHCTSKLPDGDLVRIATLGFRGEALPSIGAAARLAIETRRAGDPHAHAVTVEGGVVGAVRPAAGPAGTRVTVSDLFYATPARRKFLKSVRSETEAALDAVRRLALASPGVAYRVECDGAVRLDLPAADRAARAEALLGEGLRPAEAERDGHVLTALLAPATISRASSAGQGFVVNGRPVADPLLKLALRLGYREVIEAGRHPVAALFLTCPAESVDVNVHPAKSEVRFRDPELVRGLVIGTVRRALGIGAGGGAGPRPSLILRPAATPAPGFAEAQLGLGVAPAARAVEAETPPPVASHPLGAPLAQLADTYVLAADGEGGLILVDQHAAHERLTEEGLREQLASGSVARQPLLLPAVVDLPAGQVAVLLEERDALDRLGLEIEAFGPGAVLVRALPALLGAPDPAPLLRDIADALAETGTAVALEARLSRMIARLACHGSIRAGRRLALPEMAALLRRMEATPRAGTCSHGRPTWIRLERRDLERLFHRA